MYLHKRSDHPKIVTKSISYGLGIRIKRICDDKEEYEQERSKIKERLTQRGYNLHPCRIKLNPRKFLLY
jgi:hypothetical protein